SSRRQGDPCWRSVAVICKRHVGSVALLLPACFGPSFHHPMCGPDGECPRGMICGTDNFCQQDGSGTDADGIPGVWSLDTAAELSAPGHTVQSMTIEPAGSLTPTAYTYGGLVAHGLQGTKLWQHSDTSWTNLDTVTASGAGLWQGESIGAGSVLEYVGI